MGHKENLVTDAIAGRSPSLKGYIRAACPICPYVIGTEDRHAALSVNANNGFYRCWRCGSKGRLNDYGYGDEGSDSEADTQIELPEGFYALSDSRCEGSLIAAEAMEYLTGRGIEESSVHACGMGVVVRGKYSGRVCVPVVDAAGELVGWCARTIRNAEPKYIYPSGMQRGEHLYNEEALLRDDEHPVLAVEGIFDSLRYLPSACAFLGKPSAAHIRKLRESKRPLVIAMDGDSWREGCALAMQLQVLGKQDIRWLKLPPGEDPDSFDVRILM